VTEVLLEGRGTGPLLRLAAPLSFWGGVDAEGTIIDPHHPDRGRSVAGAVLSMTSGRGSSSSSSVLAELVRSGHGPAAVLLQSRDAIVVTGLLVAAELYGTRVPVVLVGPDTAQGLRGTRATVDTSAATIVRPED